QLDQFSVLVHKNSLKEKSQSKIIIHQTRFFVKRDLAGKCPNRGFSRNIVENRQNQAQKYVQNINKKIKKIY
ncbi:MAG: hypothetical protein K2N06_03085, partial [Oscillospiraceae bacterium]|nr:hypothetical protein [Oscillospiraceae bacterium]